jgi:hypothetical protein
VLLLNLSLSLPPPPLTEIIIIVVVVVIAPAAFVAFVVIEFKKYSIATLNFPFRGTLQKHHNLCCCMKNKCENDVTKLIFLIGMKTGRLKTE